MKLGLTLAFYGVVAFAQEGALVFNGSELKVGMKKADVLALLAEHNDLNKRAGSGDTWCAKPKHEQSAEPCPCQFSFLGESLSVANKRHGRAVGDDAAKLVSALYSRMKEIQDAGASVGLRTEEFNLEGERVRSIVFEVGITTRLTLTTTQVVGDSPYASVTYLTETIAIHANKPVK